MPEIPEESESAQVTGGQLPIGPYTRPSEYAYGSADKLEALARGFFGLNWAFLANVVLSVGLNLLVRQTADASAYLVVFIVGSAMIFVIVFAATFPFNKEIGIGKDWSSTGAFLASFLMAANSVVCCGVIGFLVMQHIAASEIKKYGLRQGFLGFRKRDIEAKVQQLRSMPSPAGFHL